MSEKRFIVETGEITDCKTGKSRTAKVITDTHELCSCEDLYELCDDLNKLAEENEQLKNRVYDFEKRKIIEESAIDEDIIPKVKLLRAELFGEKYE